MYSRIIHIDNLKKAESFARKGKEKTYGVRLFDKDRDRKLNDLYELLSAEKYKTSEYSVFKIFHPKEREIYRLPYYPDRIVHWAIMLVLEPIWMQSFSPNSYGNIRGRGVHLAAKMVRKALEEYPSETTYCLKMDIKKFYPSINNEVLKATLRDTVFDARTLKLLDEIVDSTSGVPIGNYLSQPFANLYLNELDEWIANYDGVFRYFRYCDDMVVVGPDKRKLHALRKSTEQYLNEKLKLELKKNYQVFPVMSRGISFVGYVTYHTHQNLRKNIKKSWARSVAKGFGPGTASWASYYGWAKHANCINLTRKLKNQHENLQRL